VKTTDKFAQMGMAALLPGMQHMLDLMEDHLKTFRAALAHAQSNGASSNGTEPEEPKKRGRPPGLSNSDRSKSYWGKMTPEERTAEMSRRFEVHRQKAAAAAGAGNKAAAKKARKVSNYQKNLWASYTPEERAERIRKAHAGRTKRKRAAARKAGA
jgi:hypothetical protein